MNEEIRIMNEEIVSSSADHREVYREHATRIRNKKYEVRNKK